MSELSYIALLALKDAEIGRLQGDLSRVHAQLAEMIGKVDRLTDAVARSNERISELLVIVQRKKAGSRPEKPEKPPEPPPVVEGVVAAGFADRPTAPEPPGLLHDRPRERPRPTGRKALPESLPADEATLLPDACARCASREFDVIDEVVEEKLTVVQQHQRRRVTRRKTCRCRDCGTRTTAEAPPAPFDRSKVTCEWLAWLVFEKFAKLVPLDRTRRYLGVQGVTLSMSFLVTQIEAAADLLAAIDGHHWKLLLAGDFMASDATGFKVQVPGAGLHHGHLEVYHRGDLVVVQYEAEKGGETQATKLKKFRGVLQVDAESRYNLTFENPAIIEAGCNAHPRRKLRDAEKVQPLLATEAGRFVGAMFGAEEEARNAGLRGDDLVAWRRDRIRPLYDDFSRWMNAVEPTLIPSDPLAKVIRYYRNHWTALTRFIEDARVPIDNSGSEREFQHVAKLRLNSLFAGGTEGAHRAAILLGIVASCRRISVDPQAYLTWALIRLGTHRYKYDLDVSELTPAAYKAGLAAR